MLVIFVNDPCALREQHWIVAESDSPSEALARPKWDTPFNWALNILKH